MFAAKMGGDGEFSSFNIFVDRFWEEIREFMRCIFPYFAVIGVIEV